jgi:Pro-kumamolisin, activation domain/Abnormal spindle-like microcephaly-assoc'd, ASPM-SPD-2-Hydin
MIGTRKAVVCFFVTLGISGLNLAQARTNNTTGATPSRIIQSIDETQLVRLTGNTHPLALPKFDQGLASPAMSMDRMLLLLKRSPEQEAALSAFMAEQYDPKSPNFHHWLHAKEFGEEYGPSDADIAMVTGWLQQSGFIVENVSNGHTVVEFSGTASQVQQAFHTEIHRYLVHGVQHTANDRDPQIPAALAPVIAGIASLHNFFPAPQSVLGSFVRKDKKTGKLTAAHSASGGPAPQLTYINGSGQTREDITPFDFATIYNELPLWNAGTAGAGVKIAISAVSDITLSDVATFRSSFGLPKNVPVIIHNGADPGLNGGQVENTLDVEWSGATAPAATVVAVVSASTATTGGDELSDLYIIDNEVAPIMSASYGQCELNLGKTGNAAINAIWQQGAAEGISEFESSGDQGSTGCEDSDEAGPNAATTGLQVNGIASSPYITAVGGTDFTWQTSPVSTYWNASNSSNGATAIGYIPEKPWNSTCADPFLASQSVDPTPEAFCNDVLNGTNYFGLDGLVVITGGSGGVSACTEPTGTTPATCKGGYTKPTWQAGTGVPKDGLRDLPDVSLFASDGYPDGIDGSAYLICVSSDSPEKSCDYNDPDFIIYQEVGGTSVSSPAMAGIMALVLQNNGGAPQGLANPVFYALAAKQNLAACNSSTVANGSSCVFYDTTSGSNAQVCINGSTDCVTKDSSDQLGIVSGYKTTKGYDLATGLGSVNATNLVNAWTSSLGKVTLTPSTLTFASTTVGVASAPKTVTVKNAGAALSITAITFTGSDASSYSETTTCPASPAQLASGASCTVSVTFTPATSGTLTAQLNIADNAAGSPQTASLTGTGAGSTKPPTVTLTPTSLTFASTAVGSTSATKVVTLKNTSTAILDINTGGITVVGADPSSFTETTTCGTTLAAGASCRISVKFVPVSAGSLTASLSVADNATGSPQAVSLAGTATGTAPVVSLTPVTLKFVSTKVGSTSAAKLVTLKNTGGTTLKITSGGIKISGTDATSFIKTTTCGATVAAGASCTISVSFKPVAAGALTASLTIADNAAGSPQSVSMSGTATAVVPVVLLTPKTLTFLTTTVGSASVVKVVTLKNTGKGVLGITSGGIKITGAEATSFTKTTTCGTTVAPAASCTISITFRPKAAGAATASLTVTDNAATSPQAVSLKGTGK